MRNLLASLLFLTSALCSFGGTLAQADDLTSIPGKLDALIEQGNYQEAITVAQQFAIDARRVYGETHPAYPNALYYVALVNLHQGHLLEAERVYQLTIALFEASVGSNHIAVGTSLNDLAAVYASQGRYSEAEPLYKRSLKIHSTSLGPEHIQVAQNFNNLANLYRAQERATEAESMFRRSFEIYEKALGPNHPDVALVLNNLALVYMDRSRYDEAEPLLSRSLAIRETFHGPDHVSVATSLAGLAELYRKIGRTADAEPLYARCLAIREKALGPDHPEVSEALNNLAFHYAELGRFAEAEPLFTRSIAIRKKTSGPAHAETGKALSNLAQLYADQRRYGEAEPLYKDALQVLEASLGPEHLDVVTVLHNFAWLYLAQSEWAEAAAYWRKATEILTRRAEKGIERGEGESSRLAAVQSSASYTGLIKVSHQLAVMNGEQASRLAPETFELAQWGEASSAGISLSEMAQRSSTNNDDLGRLLRERQDLLGEWRDKDSKYLSLKIQSKELRDPIIERELSERLATITRRWAKISEQLTTRFPEHARLASSHPITLGGAQAQLSSDEALVLLLDTDERFKPLPEETFLWVVTKTDSRWVRSELGSAALAEKIQALRCGLDDAEWEGVERLARCVKLLAIGRPGKEDPLPFSFKIAHELYKGLFGPVEDLIKGKRLLIVPSGPLTSLPLQVLVSEPPKVPIGLRYEDYANVAWLAREHSSVVLPSVAALKSLRVIAKSATGPALYAGFGDPSLVGNSECPKIASSNDVCPSGSSVNQVTSTPRGKGLRRTAGLDKIFRKGSAQQIVLSEVRSLCPLPDTAQEIRCVARILAIDEDEIYLGSLATETAIDHLNMSGKLAKYKVLHFATHGLLAGDMEEITKRQGEPALVLTPPKRPKNVFDDGLLTSSEIINLKLNADWVILSACNTAAGAKLGADALSGLATAFFYAGARALLVSHWPVYSDAAVTMITKTFTFLDAHPERGRAEAHRQAMLALSSDRAQKDNAHPSVWAPFVIVGEGGGGGK